MSNTGFTSVETAVVPPDPHKHVNYTQGMVLGVDDFTQEFAYLSNCDQWLTREAIGYGTVSGLRVSLNPKGTDPFEISVSPGTAISPRGQLIRIDNAQCAKIPAWLNLSVTIDALTDKGLSAAANLTAYVVLCYRDCPTDELPIPGEPCRCDSETMAASRIMDDFRLELTLDPPPQTEEDAVRAFVELLRRATIEDIYPADPAAALQRFLDELRYEFLSLSSPPDGALSPPSGSPPTSFSIPKQLSCEWLRAATRLWATELRPGVMAKIYPAGLPTGDSCDCGCHGTGDPLPNGGADCVLLARVSISRAGNVITAVSLDEENRPIVVHLRMLQELLLCGPACSCSDTVSVPAESPPSSVPLEGSPPSSPLGNIPGPDDGALVAENLPLANAAVAADPGTSPDFARADHTHGIPPSPIPPHVADVTAHLAHEIDGDVTQTLGTTLITRLQGKDIKVENPVDGDIIRFSELEDAWITVPPEPAAPVSDAVLHPQKVGNYFIVAAGIITAKSTTINAYNKLRFRFDPNTQTGLITYGSGAATDDPRVGYTLGNAEIPNYVVKATSFGVPSQNSGPPSGLLHVIRFQKDGILVQFVSSNEKPLAQQFLVEISAYTVT